MSVKTGSRWLLPGLHQPALFLAEHPQIDFGHLGAGVSHQLRQHMNRQRPAVTMATPKLWRRPLPVVE